METYIRFMNLQGDVFECELSDYSSMEELNEAIISAIGANYWIDETEIPEAFREDCALLETGSDVIYPLGGLHEDYFDFKYTVTEEQDAFFAWIDDQNETLTPNNYKDLHRQFLDAYQCEWNSREDFARDAIRDICAPMRGIIWDNINWEGVIDDLESDYTFLDSPSSVDAVFVFRN